jgi:EAL domain-containing protein (putative c-di-GMP-specific phosphodiesterase class I)
MGMACDEVQGFHIAHPMTAEALAVWMARHDAASFRRADG